MLVAVCYEDIAPFLFQDCTINRLTLDNENLKLELLKKEEEIALMLQNVRILMSSCSNFFFFSVI